MKILIIEDHPITAIGIEMMVKNNLKATQIFRVDSAVHVLRNLAENEIDVIISDISVPNLDTHSLLYRILTDYPDVKILIYTSMSIEVYGKKYLNLGVKGFLSKQSSEEEFGLALKTIASGNTFIPSELLQALVGNDVADSSDSPFTKLSPRELEILRHLLDGKSQVEIAKISNLQKSTVGTQKSRILNKLGVSNFVGLLRLAEQYEFKS